MKSEIIVNIENLMLNFLKHKYITGYIIVLK